MKAIVTIASDPDGGYWFSVEDANGEWYAGGTSPTIEGTYDLAFPYTRDLLTEVLLPLPDPEPLPALAEEDVRDALETVGHGAIRGSHDVGKL